VLSTAGHARGAHVGDRHHSAGEINLRLDHPQVEASPIAYVQGGLGCRSTRPVALTTREIPNGTSIARRVNPTTKPNAGHPLKCGVRERGKVPRLVVAPRLLTPPGSQSTPTGSLTLTAGRHGGRLDPHEGGVGCSRRGRQDSTNPRRELADRAKRHRARRQRKITGASPTARDRNETVSNSIWSHAAHHGS
jgi:hypothetical protein